MPDERNIFQRGGVWWYQRKINGQRIRRSLRTRSVIEARKLRDDLNRQYDRFAFDGTERVTWKRAVTEWARHAPSRLKPRSVDRYKMSLRKMRPILDDKYLDEITRKVIARVAHREGVSNATRKRDLTAVSDVLRFACAQGWLDENVARTYDRTTIRERRSPFVEPSEDDIKCLKEAGPETWAAAMDFARASGMRQEEIFSLEYTQFRDDGIQLTSTKTNSPRMVPWMPGMREAIDSLPAHIESRFVFWHGNGQRYHNVASQFLRIRKQANRDRERPITITFHGFRHLFAIEYLRKHGRDRLPTLSLILGHTSVKTTEGYLGYGATIGATVDRVDFGSQ